MVAVVEESSPAALEPLAGWYLSAKWTVNKGRHLLAYAGNLQVRTVAEQENFAGVASCWLPANELIDPAAGGIAHCPSQVEATRFQQLRVTNAPGRGPMGVGGSDSVMSLAAFRAAAAPDTLELDVCGQQQRCFQLFRRE